VGKLIGLQALHAYVTYEKGRDPDLGISELETIQFN
jgi:hypothetical protein